MTLPAQLDTVLGTVVLFALLVVPGAVAAVLWAPFLAFDRVRALFRRISPIGSGLVAYGVVMLLASLPFVLGTGAGMVVGVDGPSERTGARMANAILDYVVPVAGLYLVGIPVLGAAVLPRLGVDWDPTGYGADTWAVLFGGALWYVIVFAVPILLIAFFLALPL